MEAKTVKSIKFKLELKGRGVVNYDSSEQKFFTNKHCGTVYKNDNLKLAKKVFKKIKPICDDDEKVIDVESTLKISSACLRNAIFNITFPNSLALYNDCILANFISSPQALVRGYMETIRGNVYNKKGAISVTDAVATNNPVPYLEVGSCNRFEGEERSSTSLYYQETVGDVDYYSEGCIDISQLQIISADPLFGRVAIKEKWIESGNNFLEQTYKNIYGRVPFKLGYYTLNDSLLTDRFAEHAIKFDTDFVKCLIKDTFKRILNVNIRRAGAYAETTSLKIKFVSDGVKDTFDNEEGWIDVSLDNIDSIIDGVEFEEFYHEVDEETAINGRKQAEVDFKAYQKEQEEKKAKEKADKKKAKKNDNEEE